MAWRFRRTAAASFPPATTRRFASGTRRQVKSYSRLSVIGGSSGRSRIRRTENGWSRAAGRRRTGSGRGTRPGNTNVPLERGFLVFFGGAVMAAAAHRSPLVLLCPPLCGGYDADLPAADVHHRRKAEPRPHQALRPVDRQGQPLPFLSRQSGLLHREDFSFTLETEKDGTWPVHLARADAVRDLAFRHHLHRPRRGLDQEPKVASSPSRPSTVCRRSSRITSSIRTKS